MGRALAVSVAAASVVALAAAATASIVLRVSPRELADAAHLVVEGRVSTVDVRWDDERTCINTYVSVSVERVHKGKAGGAVVIKVPGGRVGDEEVRVEGTAKFAAGDEAMVFLWKDGRGEWIVLGEAQGKFRLFQDAKAGRRMAENSLKDLCLVMRPEGKGPAAAAAKHPDLLPYDDLAAIVRASVEAAKKPAASSTGTGTEGTVSPPTPDASAGRDPAAPNATPDSVTDASAGRDPAAPNATPDPSATTTKTTEGEAPPPPTESPAPPAGKQVPPLPEEPKPAPTPR